MEMRISLSAPDGTHAVLLGREFQEWILDNRGGSISSEVRDRGRELLAAGKKGEKRIPRDALWGWVRAIRAAWRRAPKSYLQIWYRRPDGGEESTEAYLTDGDGAWRVEAGPGQLTLSRLTPKVAAERRKSQKTLWLTADAAALAQWGKAGTVPPEDFQRLCGAGPLRLEHVTPGQHFAAELAALEALVLHLEATGLPEAVCSST